MSYCPKCGWVWSEYNSAGCPDANRGLMSCPACAEKDAEIERLKEERDEALNHETLAHLVSKTPHPSPARVEFAKVIVERDALAERVKMLEGVLRNVATDETKERGLCFCPTGWAHGHVDRCSRARAALGETAGEEDNV